MSIRPLRTPRIAALTIATLVSGSLLIPAAQGPAAAAETCPTVSPVVPPTAARLVTNPGFESGGSTPDSWQLSGQPGAATRSTAIKRSGTAALRIADTSTTQNVNVRSAPVRVLPGESLTAQAYVNPDSALDGSLYLEFWNASGTRVSATSGAVASVGSAGTWTSLTVKGDAPPEAVTADVLFYSSLAESGGVTYWDDVTLTGSAPPSRKFFDAGFEELRPVAPSLWTTSAGTGTTVSVVTGASAHTGGRAVRITDSNTGDGASALSRAIPIDVGETMTVSAWAKGTSGTLYVEGYSGATRVIACTVQAHSSAWHQLTASLQATAANNVTTVRARLYSTYAATGTTDWDDVTARSSKDAPYDPSIGTGSVLLVGDERLETVTGADRQVHQGQHKTAYPNTGTDAGWGSNPRLSGSIVQVPASVAPGGRGGYYMFYTQSGASGYWTGMAYSADGLSWPVADRTSLTSVPPMMVVVNPHRLDGTAPGGPLFYAMTNQGSNYVTFASNDGQTWTSPCAPGTTFPCGGTGRVAFGGQDVVTVTWDPVTTRFVATVKPWATGAIGARVVSVSTSPDFWTWTPPRLALSADNQDLADSAAFLSATGRSAPDPSTDLYSMPAIRYGEQYLGVPWVFDIQDMSPYPNGPGPDVGPAHLELASSTNLWDWSRPDRTHLVTSGAKGTFDYGFQLGSSSLLTIGNKVYFYYSSFFGEHSCPGSPVNANCTADQVPSIIGRVDWPVDRFVSFNGSATGGEVTTRPVQPKVSTSNKLSVNVSGGTVRVEVLNTDGTVKAGYSRTDSAVITGTAYDTSTAQAATWAGTTTLPSGSYRLRFVVSSGAQLFSYSVHS